MQSPSASDPSFKAFLEKLQEQNNRGFVTQLVQLKAERENAGEDNDKREKQLDDVISSLKEVRSAVTGIKIDIDLTPLVNIGENQTKLLDEIFKESSLTRKLTEGSVEYSKEMAGYRNTSGRDVINEVSGKVSKTGQVIDFETARDALSAQGKRAKEDNAFSLKPINYTPGKAAAPAVGGKGKKPADDEEDLNQPAFKGFLEEIKSGFKFFMTDGLSEKPGTGIFQTPSKEVEKKDKEADVTSPRQQNPEADNIATTGEIEADAAKNDLELSKQMLDTTKAQLVELKAIREALAPKTPKDLPKQKSTPTPSPGGGGDGGGGGGLGGGRGGMMPGMGGVGKGLMAAGKAALPWAAAAGVAVAGGAAVDYGLGKLGVGKDKEGNDLKVDTAQDDANWAKMSMGQKIQSGVGRGIEKVGSALFLDNMSREAQADRIKNETEYFKDKDFVDSSKEQDEANYKKMSFGKKILSSINRGGEKLSLFDSTKTTAARIRKETEELNKDAPGAATKEALAPTPETVVKKDLSKAEKLSRIKKEFQDSEAKEAAARDKIKEFEKANPFDVQPKGDIESGITPGKFNDPKKQAEYNKLQKESEAQGLQSIKIGNKYREADIGKDVRPLTASNAAERNKQAEEANARGSTYFGKPHKSDYKEGDEVGLSEREASRKYKGALLEKGVAREDIDTGPFRAQDQYNKLIGKELREKDVTGGPGAKNPVAASKAGTAAPAETVDGKKVSIQFSEMEFSQKDPDNYKKFVEFKEKRTEEIARDQAKKFGKKEPSSIDYQVAESRAKVEAITKFQKEIETSGAGKSVAAAEKKSVDGQVTPKETIDGKPAAVAAQPRSLEEIAMAEAKKYGRDTPNIDDKKFAQRQVQTEKLKTAGVTEGEFTGGALKKASDEDARIYSNAYDNAGGEGLSAVQKKTLAKDAVEAARAKRTMEQGSTVAQTSTENADMAREASGRGVANNTVVSNNVSSNNTTKIVPMKANPRPEYTGSSLDRYTNRITVY
jgi:hypothetical protein